MFRVVSIFMHQLNEIFGWMEQRVNLLPSHPSLLHQDTKSCSLGKREGKSIIHFNLLQFLGKEEERDCTLLMLVYVVSSNSILPPLSYFSPHSYSSSSFCRSFVSFLAMSHSIPHLPPHEQSSSIFVLLHQIFLSPDPFNLYILLHSLLFYSIRTIEIPIDFLLMLLFLMSSLCFLSFLSLLPSLPL